QVLSGIDAMHDAAIIHRDLKPANVGRHKGTAVVCDFGLAYAEDVSKLTQAEMRPGTPAYMSPEQASGGMVTNASDIYSIGAMLYEMLSGKRPHEADSYAALMHKIVSVPPAPIAKWRSDLPDGVEKTLDLMLAKEPSERPTASEATLMFASKAIITTREPPGCSASLPTVSVSFRSRVFPQS
ncbi:MAG: serine/threonine protein kinase, partial [Planctomycetes bacterium]|nr:serine/threonine protein kinase [Planctomycetota bacterium]